METGRVKSIDVFRGLTIFTMIFVNDVAGVKDAPWWMKHMPADLSGMTFVDVVFPAFLFIVGMSIPFAIGNRIKRGATNTQIWMHILIRTVGLLVLGFFMVNIHNLNPDLTGMSKRVWELLFFTAVILLWNQYPQAGKPKKFLYFAMRLAGVIILIWLAAIYRGGEFSQPVWMQTSWWGILGLIGWAYLASCAVFFLFNDKMHGIIGSIAFFIALYIGDQNGMLNFLQFIKNYLWLGGHIGGHAAICTAGMAVSLLFLKDSPVKTFKGRLRFMFWFSIGLAVCGYLLQQPFGINKNMATPAWDLYCSAICSLIFMLLFWIVDKLEFVKWSEFLKPAGSNPLLAYILPDIFYTLLGIFHITLYSEVLGNGSIGILRSIVFSVAILYLTKLLGKLYIRLHL